ncbi:uracil-DNA glycosylase family protein [Parvibaculum sedimenti]|uniref:Uracil-DNA glycosylase family protein n=3 Tax=Parvibaculum sedimenti TaxID=2608632 RepID=A0A6N6VL70_9HYPH|nr:uracil-DNA glycosylase family protein [Parvibaculum sedimenti]KAB7741502.1 uracil-DNA glycosylase family protein [Parvibaculum sedimenti]
MSRSALDKLAREIRACRLCIDEPAGKPLPHEPRPVLRVSQTARLCIVGQAPGTRVHASGMPFTDPSGDRLRDWMGVSSEEFYDVSRVAIVPMGFCFPGLDAKGGDRPPRRECAGHWRTRLFELMPQIELTLLVGQYAQSWHLGPRRKASLTETVAAWRDYLPSAIPLPHPSWRNNAWIRKHPWFETDVLPALRRDVRRLIG